MPFNYYSCTTIGCVTTATVTPFTSFNACTADCRSWGCTLNVISEDTKIYAFYDISSMSMSWLHNAHTAVNSWVNTGIPGFTGEIYHVLDDREYWLEYDYVIYSGQVGEIALSEGGLSSGFVPGNDTIENAMGWKELEVAGGAVWYDMYKTGATFTLPLNVGGQTGKKYPGAVVTSSGLPPKSDYSDNILVLIFNDEASEMYHDGTPVAWGNQPNTEWKLDYSNYTGNTWAGVQSSGGVLNQYLYVATSGTPYMTICSMATPCIEGPGYALWYGQPLEQIHTTFTNTLGGTVQGCTGPDGPVTSVNPVPCPASWATSFGWGFAYDYPDVQQNHAIQAVAAISSGNKTNKDGTWMVGTAPILDVTNPGTASPSAYPNGGFYATSNLSHIANMGYGLTYDANRPNLENENPYWKSAAGVDVNIVNNGPTGVGAVPYHGGLDQYGFGVNVEAQPFTPARFTSDLNAFLALGFTAETLCTSAATSGTSQFPYATWDDCNTSDGCGKYKCSPTGCIPWSLGPFDSLSSCTATCFSYECRASGCTQIAGSGGQYYSSASTQDALTACTATCSSYECRSTGCTKVDGSGATFQTSSACTEICISYACADSGCTTFPGSGNTPYSAHTACTASCVSWDCTDNGCVIRTGTGGTYTELTACTTACVSYGCSDAGCTQVTGSGGTHFDAASPQDALTACTATCKSYNCSPTGCTQIPGTGGTYYENGVLQDSLTACTAACQSYSCTTTGCTLQTGSGGTYYVAGDIQQALSNCTGNCLSYNCSPTGCVEQTGTGGQYPDYNSCSAACYSYTCGPIGCVISGGTGSTYTSLAGCQTTCKSWNCDSPGCTEQTGTGGTHTVYSDCTDVCTSYNCRASGCTEVAGTGGTDYSACTATCSSFTCTVTGCSVQQGSGGTYYNATLAQDALTACTATCKSWNCDSTGCVEQSGTGGTFSSLTDCLTGDTINNISACTSYECRRSGCTQIAGTGVTGTFPTTLACTTNCVAFCCSDTGCTQVVGSGATACFYNAANPSVSSTQCDDACKSWDCTNTGCIQRPGTGGTFTTDVACYQACTSYYCTDGGCQQVAGTGSTYPTSSACTASCVSYSCADSGCTLQTGSGGTYFNSGNTQDALTACTATCKSYNCSDTGCVIVTGSGGTFYEQSGVQDSLTACTASCASFYCTNSGCTEQQGTGGTYSTSSSCTATCVSWNCSSTGCTELLGTGGTFATQAQCATACTSYYCTDSGCTQKVGTGSTYATEAICTASCVSYGCTDSGCTQQVGSGATHFNRDSVQDALTACTASCISWNCTDSGCTQITGTGGTYSAVTSCTASCTSWYCTVTGCTEQTGTGGTYANSGLCTTDGACVSYYCMDTGCTQVAGSGGSISSSATCTASCTSWNCTNTGCVIQQGTGGTFATQVQCTTACSSYYCMDTGCTEVAGTGATFATSSACTASCASFYCTDIGCTEQTGTGGTFSTSATCTASCQTWNCSDNGCVAQDGTGGTYSTLISCTASCYSYTCTDTGCTQVTGSGGTHYNLAYPSHAQTACTASCVSWDCGPTGVITGPNNSACIEQVGTGSTWAIEQDCVQNCQSWNCGESGCEFAAGSGGTWYYLNDPSLSQTNCAIHCWSWWCDENGCEDEPGSGSTFYVFNAGDINFDNVYAAQTACTEDCQQWTCTTQSGLFGPNGQPTGCLHIPGTGLTNTVQVFDHCYTACTSYDCGPQGCYLAVGGQGQYTDILTCENACMSWQCTDSGCELLEGNTGDTLEVQCITACTSYDCTDTGCVPRPGLGGQHLTLASCNSSCESWYCTNTSCVHQQGSGATFNSLQSCSYDCQSWNCEDFGCSQQAGTGATHTTSAICSTACTSWECNGSNPLIGPLGCYELSGTGWTHSSQVDCTGNCVSYMCEEFPLGCVEQQGLTGFLQTQIQCENFCKIYFCGGLDGPLSEKGCYSVPGNPFLPNPYVQFTTLQLCQDACVSWDCLASGCTQYPETGHTYATDVSCANVCTSWECSGTGQSYGCVEALGTGSTWQTQAECDCFSYDCGPIGCIPIPGGGGYYADLTACTSECKSYNCSDTGCYVLTGNSGDFLTVDLCTGTCISYNCTDTGCTEQTGTGGTSVDLAHCVTGCTSWECLSSGCTEYYGTGHTYISQNYCEVFGSCFGWQCTDSGVLKHPGTGWTYSSYLSAVDMCKSYECFSTYLGAAIDGCDLVNPATAYWMANYDYGYWGTGGTYDAMSSCTANCIHWGCNHIAITQYAKVYVYYDITSMGFTVLEEAYDRVTDWIQSIPGWSGTTQHILTQSQERWLSWPVITYSGRSLQYDTNHTTNVPAIDPWRSTFSEFPFGSYSNSKVSKCLYWAANTQDGLSGNFWDQGISGSCSPPVSFSYSSGYLAGVSLSNHVQCYQGPPPTASTEDDVINIIFLDEANQAYHSNRYTWGSKPTFWPLNQLGGGVNDLDYQYSTQASCNWLNASPQPTTKFRYDYTRYMEIWNTVTGTTSGSVRSFFYPRPATIWVQPLHAELALNAFASIHSGNQDDIAGGGTGILDGTWLPGTAPRSTGVGQGPATPYYSKANLSMLEVKNPYTINYAGTHYVTSDPSCPTPPSPNNLDWQSSAMTGGVGFLDRFGWGINISLDTFYTQTFYDDMNEFLTASTAGNFVIGCVSAETQQTLQYPFESASGCSSGCTGLSCSDYGCVLGSVDQFTSSNVCSAACQSYNCELAGCVWQYGTGGTFYNATDGTYGLADCQAACNSFNCVDILSLANANDQGCEMIVGTGGTFANYSSCTATCQSWNCECDCTIYAPISAMTACTNMPNTGGTYSALTSCTATCSTGASWYCSAQTVNSSGTILTPCYVFCGNGGYYSDGVTPIPMNLVYGPYTTSGAADTVCCGLPLTWDCTGTSIVNSCLNRTLIPGTYVSGGDALEWFTTYLAAQGITGFSYESTTQAYTLLNSCEGPNGGIMYELHGVAHPNVNGGTFYPNWNAFVLACIAASVPLVTAGLTFASVNALLFATYADNIIIFEEPCFCEDAECDCVVITDGSGEFSALTACTTHCCTGDTTWNCITTPYKPICKTKPSLGTVSTPTQVMDHFRTIDPTGTFALSKFYPFFNTVGAPVNVTWSTVWANTYGQGQSTHMDCYKKVIGTAGVTFLPTTYIESISHPMISGGTPFHTWQTFIDSVVAAGVTGTAAATTNSVCTMIDTQLSPWFPFGCNILTKPCCSPDDCYCYELFETGGTYNNQIDCEVVCCPQTTGYTCDLVSTCIGPIAYSNVYSSWFTGPSAQSDCLSWCSGTTTWDCVPAVTTGTCDDAQYGEFPPNSLAFQMSTIAYPFNTCSITNVLGLPGVAEKVLTNITYMNPNWAFSSVTWELGVVPVIVPSPNPCYGKFGKPLYRLMSVWENQVDNGTPYPSWGTFIAAAQADGFTVSVGQNITTLNAPNGPFKMQMKIEQCICNTSPCHCIEIFGSGGVFSTSALCENICCNTDSWNCTINGCVDPGNGTGTYLSLSDCQPICEEWLCGASIPPNHIDGKIASGIVGSQIDQIIYLVSNVPTSTPFSDYRYEDANFPQGLPCVGNSGYPWRFVTGIGVQLQPSSIIVTPQLTTWDSFINYLNTTYSWLPVTTSMSYNDVYNTIYSANNNIGPKVGSSSCVCNILPCDCHTVPGTGHTNGYHITDYVDCENDCCSGVCIDTCGVLMVGRSHGVSTYDINTNTPIHLFDSTIGNNFHIADIAAGFDYIWIYESGGANCRIEEHKIISLCPFQHVFVRVIQTAYVLGKGMSAMYDNQKVLVSLNSVSGLSQGYSDGLVATLSLYGGFGAQVLFQLPQYQGGAISSPPSIGQLQVGDQYQVTGDILFSSSSGKMLILYGYGSYVDMWIGEWDFAGNQLQTFHITGGLAYYDYFTSLFEDSFSGRKYAISRDGVVCEIKTSPLTILPPLQQIPDYHPTASPVSVIVNGATNILNTSTNCISLLVPTTYNCKVSGGGCVDPKDGTGKYSVFNGAKSVEDALATCKSSCTSNTWDCKSTPEMTDALYETGYELPDSITNEISAYDYVSQTPSLHEVPLNQIYFQNVGITTVDSKTSNTDLTNQTCWPNYSNGWKYSLDNIEITPSKIVVTTWDRLITNLKSSGVDVDTSSTRSEVVNKANTHFDTTIPFTQNSKARTCFMATCECVEVIGSGGFFSTSGGCLDSCCPTYNCAGTGCIDPLDGSGKFKGISGLTECKNECRELLCVTSQAITDSCTGKITPAFNYTPYDTSFYTVLSWFADPANSSQQTNFTNYKWIKQVPAGTSLPGHCDNSMLGSIYLGWPFNTTIAQVPGTEAFWFHYTNNFTWTNDVYLGWPYNTTVSVVAGNFYADSWFDVITYAQNNGCPTVTLSMTFQQVQTEMQNVCGVMFAWSDDYCKCTYTNCGCQEVVGTGYTGSYPYWDQTICDDNCCPNAIVIKETEMGLIDELDKIIYEPKEVIAANVDYAVQQLNALREDGKTGDDCQYCNNNNGVCLYDGCMSYTNLEEFGTSQLNWMFDSAGPSGPSYDCFSTGCYLVWNGSSGQFNGANALSDCQNSCVSYNCVPGDIADDCDQLIQLEVKGEASTALSFIADIENGYQREKFSSFKYEEIISEIPENSCPTNDGNVWAKISTIKATDFGGEKTIINNTNTWNTFISELSKTGYAVTDEMSYSNVVQVGELAEQKFKIKISHNYCICTGQPCHCTTVVGTGGTGTYPNLTLCNQAASTNPCCNTDVNSYNCTINGCEQHLGVGLGTYTSSYALWECQQDCSAWGCQDIQLTLTTATTVVTPYTSTSTTVTTGMSSADTVIHVWYDTSSMGTALLNTAQNAINSWVTTEQQPGGFLDGWVGLLHHSLTSSENWITWPTYSMNQWGLTPYKNLIVVCLIDESNKAWPQNDPHSYTPGVPGGEGKVPDISGNWNSAKSQFINERNQWIANGGTIQTLVYAASDSIQAGTIGQHRQDFIRHIFAAINGNNLHVTNGTWTLDPTTNNPITTNGNAIFGGPAQTQHYGTNDFIDLSWAVTTANGYRNDVPLSSYGVYGVYNRRGLASFTQQALGGDIQQFITSYPTTTTNIITSTIYNSATTYSSSTYIITGQCVSAQTTINTSYPFVSQTDCDTQDCVYNGWNCGINGCYPQPNGQYLNWDDCDEACYSYTCQTQITGLIQEGTLGVGSYCQEFHNGIGTTVPVTGSGYDAMSYYMDSVINGFSYPADGYGNVDWFINLWDNTGNNTGGVQTTVYPAIMPSATNYACYWNVGCIGPGTYSTVAMGGTDPLVLEVYSTLAACQSGLPCILSGGTGTTTAVTGTIGLIVEDDGLGNCETPSGGRLCRIDNIELLDTVSGLPFYDIHSNTVEHFIQTMIGNLSSVVPGFPAGIPGVYQGMSLFSLIQVGQLNDVRRFNVKIYVKGCPCSHSCDCVKLVGTGQTGTYFDPTDMTGAYNDCVDDCCASLNSWSCPTNAVTAALYGCIDPLDGSGAYSTKALCDSNCPVTWMCSQAGSINSCPNVSTYMPYTLTQSYFTNQDPGFMMAGTASAVPLASTYGPGGVNSDIEALMYILDEGNGLYNTQLNNIGYARDQSYLTPNQQCDYPNGGGRKLGVMEYFYQDNLSSYYCMEYEMRVNGVPFMPWTTTASTQSAFNRCTGGSGVASNIPNTKYTSVKQMLDVIEWMYSQPATNVLGQQLSAGPCNGNSKHFSSLFNPGPNTASCNSAKPAASNGFRSNLKLKDFWEAGLFRPHYGWGITATSPVTNWLASWGSGVSPDGTNIQYGSNQMPIIGGRELIINGTNLYNSTECQCFTSCSCQPVLGSGGHPSQLACLLNCCPTDVCTICCRDTGGVTFTIQQLGTNCTCPIGSFQVQCDQVPTASCKVGQTWNSELKQCVADTALPCMAQYCPPGYMWSDSVCDCVICQEQECGADKTWNSSICDCESVSLPCPEEACATNYTWDSTDCLCKCVTQSCTDGYVWNSSTCQCDAIAGEIVYGCTDPTATNYNSDANTNDGTCTYSSDEESDERAENQPHTSGLILNELTHEYARGCIISTSADEAMEIYGTYSNLNDCLNSGVAGTWTVTREIDSTETFGIAGREDTPSIIPMCCQDFINTKTTDEYASLDYSVCHDWCISQTSRHGGNYVPLYNVVGPNTTDEESILIFYQNIYFINHVHAGNIIINSESEHDDLAPLH